MPTIKRKITPFLWFDTQAEEAAQFYTSIFDNSQIVRVNRYGKAGRETHGMEAGSVMTVEFEIEGQPLVALNGGPHFQFTEAFSLQVNARRKPRSTISGASCRKAAPRAAAAGSRINTAFPGRSCRRRCRKC